MDKKRKQEKAGRIAEGLACFLLRARGFRIVARRYRPRTLPRGASEIDIIAKRRNLFIFVEVKFRQKSLEEAIFSFTQRQQQAIAKTAEIFLAYQSGEINARFDAIFFSPWKLPVYIKNAWYAET